MELLVGIVLIVVVAMIYQSKQNKKRRAFLLSKYNNEDIVNLIVDKKVWQGQTQEQLIDSWGKADQIDQKILKTKTKETWKYGKSGANRYNNKVHLENGIVIGWDTKK